MKGPGRPEVAPGPGRPGRGRSLKQDGFDGRGLFGNQPDFVGVSPIVKWP